MKNTLIIASSAFVGIAACVVAVFLAGGGHGTYFPAKVFFPYTMVSTGILVKITPPFIVLACVQFPLYGVILSIANTRGDLRPVAGRLVIIHIIAVILAFAFSGSGFRP